MQHSNVDGIVFVPEMMDEVVFKSDLGAPLSGRPAVAALLEKLESLYISQDVIFETRQGARDIRICRATLTSGAEVELTTVALRDASGWVCELRLGHQPLAPVKAALAALGPS